MDPVGAALLYNSGGMAISTTFAEDGVGPETCHLSFTGRPLKTCTHQRLCLCDVRVGLGKHVRVWVCARACVCVCDTGEPYHDTCFTEGGQAASLWQGACVCMRVFVRVCHKMHVASCN